MYGELSSGLESRAQELLCMDPQRCYPRTPEDRSALLSGTVVVKGLRLKVSNADPSLVVSVEWGDFIHSPYEYQVWFNQSILAAYAREGCFYIASRFCSLIELNFLPVVQSRWREWLRDECLGVSLLNGEGVTFTFPA